MLKRKEEKEIYNHIISNYKESHSLKEFCNTVTDLFNEGVQLFPFKSKGQVKRSKKKIINEFITQNSDLKKIIIKDFDIYQKFSADEINSLFQKSEIYNHAFYKKNLNGFLKAQKINFNRKKREESVKSMIRDHLEGFYQNSKVRLKKRKIIYNVGPTNSGKSYSALQAFEKANNACYLAPLRLLAWEIFEKFPNLKIDLITGEERNINKESTHTSSTIEMANFHKEYDVAIIDEIQMIGDAKRGWAWTKAFLMINADVIYLCGDESVLNLIQKIVYITGDNLEIVEHERKTDLKLLPKVVPLSQLKKGDALVVFSRKDIYYYKNILENEYHKKVSVIYGMLSPEVRKNEAQRFVNEETDIVISTDAIGMGLNLPIKRVIFSTLNKYYNKKIHPLSISQLKQIGGRAGRYGLEDVGFVGLLDQSYNSFNKYKDLSEINSYNQHFLKRLKMELFANVPEINKAFVGVDFENYMIINDKLKINMSIVEYLFFFKSLKFKNDIFIKSDIDDQMEVSSIILNQTDDIDHKDFWNLSIAPVLLRNEDHLNYFETIVKNFMNQENIFLSHQKANDLENLEIALKKIDLYLWLKNQTSSDLFNESIENLNKIKNSLVSSIIYLLTQN